MELTDYTTAVLMPKGGYTSCIKIKGIPILPPLITESKRLEIENYKQQAIEIEKRLKSQLEPFKNNSKLKNRTLENFLSFGNNISHIQALDITDISKKLPSKDCKTVVPLNKNKPRTNLTCNIFDVSEYSDKGVVIFKQLNEDDSGEGELGDGVLNASTVELDLSESCSSGDTQVQVPGHIFQHETINKEFLSSTILINNLQEIKSKPRLIRSNSYTLESPSPVLIEHFRKQSEQSLNILAKTSQGRSLDLGNYSHSPILLPEKSIFTLQGNNDHTTEDYLDNMSDLLQNLAQKHFGEASELDESKTNKNDTFLLNSQVGEEFQEVLSDMPENYAKDIVEFLERHNKEQEIKFKSYDTFKQRLFEKNINLEVDTSKSEDSQIQHPYIEFDPLSPSPHDELNNTIKSSCDSQVIVFNSSMDTTVNGFNTSTPLLIDFESDSCDTEPLVQFELNSTFSNSDPLHVLKGCDDYRRLTDDVQVNKSPNCSRELFPDGPDKMEQTLKEQWAATIITAAAKGFLVRRLKRTERVKNLILTIQDALVCAMDLHTESTESIRPPDVELHRRLIQQVSAACFEFYDVFFNLTTQEQMAVIALDRQRLKEKLKRPKSSSSLKLDSNKSTPNSQRHTFNNIRQKKPLTPSFAA